MNIFKKIWQFLFGGKNKPHSINWSDSEISTVGPMAATVTNGALLIDGTSAYKYANVSVLVGHVKKGKKYRIKGTTEYKDARFLDLADFRVQNAPVAVLATEMTQYEDDYRMFHVSTDETFVAAVSGPLTLKVGQIDDVGTVHIIVNGDYTIARV